MKLKSTNEQVKVGEKLFKIVELLGISIPIEEIEVNETTLPGLIKEGVIIMEGADSDIDITIDGAIRHLVNRIGWKRENFEKYIRSLYKISPAAVFGIILKEIAYLLDKRYPDHISKSEEIWIISSLNGKIQQVQNPKRIKNFKNFAAFRSLKDALIAKKLLAPILEDMYGKQKS